MTDLNEKRDIKVLLYGSNHMEMVWKPKYMIPGAAKEVAVFTLRI